MSKLLLLSFLTLSFISFQSKSYACALCENIEPHQEKPKNHLENNKAIFDSIKNESTVVIAFHSKSCTSCKIQKPELESILKEPSHSAFKNFFMDFESTPVLRKELNVKFPSTIIVFKKGKEISRVIGETERTKLSALIQKGF
jgi:thiol-disulfide isomerase/thioredoxin